MNITKNSRSTHEKFASLQNPWAKSFFFTLDMQYYIAMIAHVPYKPLAGPVSSSISNLASLLPCINESYTSKDNEDVEQCKIRLVKTCYVCLTKFLPFSTLFTCLKSSCMQILVKTSSLSTINTCDLKLNSDVHGD